MQRFLFIFFLFGLCFANLHFDAIIEGSQQVPPVVTLGEASGTFKIDNQKLSWDISFNYLQSGIIGAHIHGPAEIGENAGHIIDLEIDDGDTEGHIKGSTTITKDQVEFFKHGLTYINLHTNEHPDGEVRGQIFTTSKYFYADITGSQQSPDPVLTTSFEGSADISFDSSTKEMHYEIKHDVDDATAIHIHGPARIGNNADPIILFDETKKSFSGDTILSDEHANCLKSGLLYINIHTEEHPNGEIRGQILIDEDGSGSSDDDWWIYGLVFIGIIATVALISAIAVLVYIKKGDQIRNALSSSGKTQEVRNSFSQDFGVSNEPLLDSSEN